VERSAWILAAGLPELDRVADRIQPTAARPEGIVKVPGSAKEYDAVTIAGNANPPDWFPDEHPAAPRSVRGDTGITMACGSCDLMSGHGHPESADIAGMPAEYLIRQMAYYKAGTRKDDARMGPIARATSDEDVRQPAEYFAALKPTVWVKVIETATPPKTFVATAGRHRQLHPDGGTEPIGHRILEIPGPVPHGNPRPAFRFRRVRAAGQHRQRRSAGHRLTVREDGAMRNLSRREIDRPGRSPEARGAAAAICRATALRHALRLERGESGGVDEGCRHQSG
jgi:cytochrome c553